MASDSTKNPGDQVEKINNSKEQIGKQQNSNPLVIKTSLHASEIEALRKAFNSQQNSLNSAKSNSNIQTLEIHINLGKFNESVVQRPRPRPMVESPDEKFEQEFDKLSWKLRKELHCESNVPAVSCCPCNTGIGKEVLKEACPLNSSDNQKSCQQLETTLLLNAQQLSNLTNLLSRNKAENNEQIIASKDHETTLMVDANTLSEITKLLSQQQSDQHK